MPKFKILEGKHTERGRDGMLRRYVKGEIVDSKSDLAAKFNHPGAMKFEPADPLLKAAAGEVLTTIQRDGPNAGQLIEPVKVAPAQAAVAVLDDDGGTLESMTVKELRAHAAAEEIDLGGAILKEDIIRAIQSATV